jgi:hypothetical protein
MLSNPKAHNFKQSHLLAKPKNHRVGCPIPFTLTQEGRSSAEWEVLRIALQRNSA